MSISVIIAHFSPNSKNSRYRDLLKKTIQSIRDQKCEDSAEIIVCDDGSAWSASLSRNDEISIYNRKSIAENTILSDLDIDVFLTLPDKDMYRGVLLKHHAFKIAKNEKVLVLDDDHPLTSRNALGRIIRYLDEYEFLRGRVIGPSGIPQMFFSGNAQGTTYGIRKSTYFAFGGFGKYLYENGQGEDNDILWKTYSYLTEKYPGKKKACFAGEIVTKDLASNRWADRSFINNMSRTNMHRENREKLIQLYDRFEKEYRVKHDENNSRDKAKWMIMPSFLSIMSEFYFLPVYLIKRIQLAFQRARKSDENILFFLLRRIKANKIRKIFDT